MRNEARVNMNATKFARIITSLLCVVVAIVIYVKGVEVGNAGTMLLLATIVTSQVHLMILEKHIEKQ